MNIYWKAVCVVAVAVLGFVGGWYVNGKRYQKQIASITQQHIEDQYEAEKKAREIEQKNQIIVQEQAERYQRIVASSNADIEKLKKELKNAAKNNPIPDSCNLDAGRMSIIKQAINRSNSSKD